ncbi:PocR ligand-binding domain-containing protein [uncultured Desulfobacter sp.]|uniref:PocR ligand-binding domain-containing protein n=1 Tax=uncultured Desulfobacter sp. TaxID=240139 RepID=UPI0029C91395|nr:PocR ligand-binding domain-containing protein [uncultured Desulfobacter sp.]
MSTPKSPSYDELKRRLEAAESALKAIREGRVDTISGERETLVVRLAEAEARQTHLNQVVLAIRKVNQLIVAENDPRRLIEQACVNLTETMGYHNAWIALLGGEATRGLGLRTEGPVAAAAASGFDGGFESLRERLERGEFPECMVQALANEDVFVVGDPAADCPDCPLSRHYGGRAGLACRLAYDGVTWGILTASVPAAYARDAEEQHLFNEVTGDLAFALHKISEARKLEESHRYLALVIEGSGVGTWEWNVRTNETRFNEQWAAMLGYTIEELTPYDYTTWERLVHPEDLEQGRLGLADCVAGITTNYTCEFRMKHKDGRWVWILDQGRIMTRDDTGKALSMFGTHTDITQIKQAEESLRKSESRVRRKLNALLDPEGDIGTLHLADVVDCDEIQSLMNDFHALTDIGVGIIDLDGNILVDTGYQDICMKFHRVHPETQTLCRESDTELTSGVEPGTFKIYKCKNNLWDMVTPIMVGGKHLGNLFLGQFFFEGEAPDIATFREQARRYGFDEAAYLKAYLAIPRWSRETVDRAMTFYCNLINVISRLSYARIKLARTTGTLRESESRFRGIFENAPIGIALVDLDYRLLASNKAYGDLLGRDESEIRNLLLKDFTHPDDLEENLRLQSRLGRGEIDKYSLEKRFVRKNGDVRWGHLTASLIRDSNGDPLGFLGHVLDISDRKQAEKDLSRQQRSLDLYNRIATVFLTTFGDEVFAGVLDVILRLLESRFGYFGYIDEAGNLVCPSITRDVWDQNQVAEESIVFPRSGWGGLWGRSLLEKRTLVANENLRLPQGHMALENALAAPIVHHDTLIGQFVVANKAGGYDQEDRELLEAAAAHTAPILFAIREEARQKIAHEKLETQLRQAQKMEAVGRLAGGVAHDFNNMLFIILGNVEMLSEDQPADGPFRKNLEAIRKAAEHSADLTRQLLAFARKQTVAPRVIDLNKTVESMLKMLRRLIGENIDMAWIPGENVQPVKIDPGQIDQLLANLCVNARDAITGVGKVTIETGNAAFDKAYCRNHAGFTPGEYVMLAVSDNGCGMDKKTLANIFEPFFTTKDVGKGTGLGLATVYGAVKQNNGFINVYSESGQGTTFKIYLPRHKAKTAPVPEKGADKPSERGHETILLVEDEPSVLKTTTMMLERQGYTVVGASTPSEAVRLAAEHAGHIHLLMTDVVMPEMNGRDLAKNILSFYPGLKCLFMSGYTANVIAHHGILDEAVDFIQKPFSKSDLAIKLRKVLAQN